MATRSFLFTLQRNCRINRGSGALYNLKNGQFNEFCSSSAVRSGDREQEEEEGLNYKEHKDDLKSRIFRLRVPKRSATNIIQKWVDDGHTVTASELRLISKELRKLQRYKHALEISEWMVSNKEFNLLDSDYATRIDLMTKVFGIDAAERYFEGLPFTAKTSESYTALLHSYAALKMLEKAEGLYERIKESNLSLTALIYNEMMTLYMSVGLNEKVSLVIEELKRQKVAPDIFTYNLWISSCAATLNIDQVTRILDEMKNDSGFNDDWIRYIDLANIYVKAGHLVNAELSAIVEAEKSMTQREWITYDFLIILHASLRNKDKVDQIWKSLRMTKGKMTQRNFVCILSSYMMLGHWKEAREILDQWKQLTITDFDISACDRLLDAFRGSGLAEMANNFQLLLNERNYDPTNVTR